MTSGAVFGKFFVKHAAVLTLAAMLSGCFDSKSDDPSDSSVPPTGAAQPSQLPNNPPEIAGTPAAAVQSMDTYSFTPTASDVDGDFLGFEITNQPTWAQFSEETGTLTGTPTDANIGDTDEVTITVTDGRDTRSIAFKIRVNPRNPPPGKNAPPTISGVPAGSVLVGQAYDFQPTASDPEQATLSFSISNRPSWATFSTATGRLSGAPGAGDIGTFSNIVISVSDGRSTASLPAFSIQVRAPDNSAPTISGSPGTSVQATQTYAFQPAASDPDNNTLTYSIVNRPAWASFNTSTGRLSGTPTTAQVGSYPNVVISVSDGRAAASLPAFSISVQSAPNSAPTISGSPTTSITVNTAYSFTPSASDPDDDTLGFTVQNLPGWASFNTSTGRISGTPTGAGTFSSIVISVSDGRATASLPAFSINVTATLTIVGSPATSVNADTAYSFLPTTSNPGGGTLAFSIQNRPAWATFNTTNGQLGGTPTSSNAGTYSNIVISVSNGTSSASLPAFAITVAAAPSGTAGLSWTVPTQNTDGSSLSNLAGYRITYGASQSAMTQLIELPDPSDTSHVVTGLSSGTWYFAIKAYSALGSESNVSNVVSKNIP